MVENKYPVNPDEIITSFNKFQNEHWYERRIAALSMAYINGFQQKIWHAKDHKYSDIYRDSNKRRIYDFCVNLLIDPYRSLVYQLATKDVVPDIIAKSDDRDILKQTDNVNDAMNYHLRQVWNIADKNEQWAMWGLQGGTCYAELYPEATDNKFEYVESEGKKYTDFEKNPDGTFVIAGKTVQGRLAEKKETILQVCSKTVWDIAHSCDGKDGRCDGSTWQIVRTIRTIGYLKQNYSDADLSKLELSAETRPVKRTFDADLAEAMGGTEATYGFTLKGDDREVEVYSYYHKSTPEFPKGFVMLACKGKDGVPLYFEKKLPLSNDHYSVMPVKQFDSFISSPNRYVQTPIFALVLDIQVLYNALINSQAKHARLAAAPPLTRLKGVTTDKDGDYPEFGELVQTDVNGFLKDAIMQSPSLANLLEQKFMVVPQMNTSVQYMLAELKTAVINIIGTNMANPGAMPNAELSGVSANVQATIDLMGQAPLVKAWNSFKYRLYRDAIKAMVCVYTQEEMAYILGKSVEEVKGMYENNIDDSWDIDFADMSGIPSSPTGKLQFWGGLKEILPQEWWPKVDTVMAKIIAGLEKGMESGNPEAKLAEKENEYIDNDDELYNEFVRDPKTAAEELMGMVNEIQDGQLHIPVHKEDLISPRVLELGPVRVAMRMIHIQKHEEVETTKMAGQVALQNQLMPPPPPSQQSNKQPGMNMNIEAPQANQQNPTF